ncbi:MAG: hypothetical protein QM779_08550 [Propionicimonas sp.]|uniref:hypothetical protein n=1 Tax=Propionicimonas sp. TaxID=1955623 RepID=UPI003D10B863
MPTNVLPETGHFHHTTTSPPHTLLDRLALRFGVALLEWADRAEERQAARRHVRLESEELLRDRARLDEELRKERLRQDVVMLFHTGALYRTLR